MEILLLPGMDGTGRLFAPLIPHLARELRPRVVAFSPSVPRDYDELLGELAIPDAPFAIVAESFSGPLGVKLAASYPDRVHALVLVATFLRNPAPIASWIHPALTHRAFQWRLPDLALRLGLLGMDASAEQLDALRSTLVEVSPKVLARRLGAIGSLDVSTEFASIRAPTLYLAGRDDRLVGSSPMQQMKRLRPELETRVLDAPHLVLQRRPLEAGRVISEFVLANRP